MMLEEFSIDECQLHWVLVNIYSNNETVSFPYVTGNALNQTQISLPELVTDKTKSLKQARNFVMSYCSLVVTSDTNHRITESPKLKGTHNDRYQVKLLAPYRTTKESNPTFESGVQILLKLQRACCYDHCPGEPVSVPDHLLVKDLFLTFNLNLPWFTLPLYLFILSFVLTNRTY